MEGENKYYTPEIEEFHVGFEYEAEVNGNWIKTHIYDWYEGMEGNYRVKHLDREDIESLGFEFSNDKFEVFSKDVMFRGSKYTQFIKYIPQTKHSLIWITEGKVNANFVLETTEHNYNFSCNNTLFAGKTKNKSELKKVLKMIGV